jgi:hypothetical protein
LLEQKKQQYNARLSVVRVRIDLDACAGWQNQRTVAHRATIEKIEAALARVGT